MVRLMFLATDALSACLTLSLLIFAPVFRLALGHRLGNEVPRERTWNPLLASDFMVEEDVASKDTHSSQVIVGLIIALLRSIGDSCFGVAMDRSAVILFGFHSGSDLQ